MSTQHPFQHSNRRFVISVCANDLKFSECSFLFLYFALVLCEHQGHIGAIKWNDDAAQQGARTKSHLYDFSAKSFVIWSKTTWIHSFWLLLLCNVFKGWRSKIQLKSINRTVISHGPWFLLDSISHIADKNALKPFHSGVKCFQKSRCVCMLSLVNTIESGNNVCSNITSVFTNNSKLFMMYIASKRWIVSTHSSTKI